MKRTLIITCMALYSATLFGCANPQVPSTTTPQVQITIADTIPVTKPLSAYEKLIREEKTYFQIIKRATETFYDPASVRIVGSSLGWINYPDDKYFSQVIVLEYKDESAGYVRNKFKIFSLEAGDEDRAWMDPTPYPLRFNFISRRMDPFPEDLEHTMKFYGEKRTGDFDNINDALAEYHAVSANNPIVNTQASAILTSSQVYEWVQARYKHYDDLYNNGAYSGDKYEAKVFSDAAAHFNVSLSKVRELYDSFRY